METRARYVVVGSIVMAIFGLAFLFVLYISSGQREFDEYDIIFRERVTGLSNGSVVRFNGIQKGEVVSLSIDPSDPSVVIARVHVDRDTPIKTDTKAELEPVGFTGLAIIQFVGGTAEAPLIKDQSPRRVPQVEADASGIALFLEATNDLVGRAGLLLSDENIDRIKGILANIDDATKVIADNRGSIENLIQNGEAASEDLVALMEDLRSAADGLEQILAEGGPEALEDADRLLKEANELVSTLKAIAEENRRPINRFTDRGLGQIAPTLAEARDLMRNMNALLVEVERDPKAFLLGEHIPEYEGADE